MSTSNSISKLLPPPPGLPLRQGEEGVIPLLVKEGLGVVELSTQRNQGNQ